MLLAVGEPPTQTWSCLSLGVCVGMHFPGWRLHFAGLCVSNQWLGMSWDLVAQKGSTSMGVR